MLRRTKQILPPLQVGEPVLLPIPEFDRGRLDCRNIPGVVVAVTDRETYRVGTKHGTVSNSYSRSELVKGDCAIVTVGEVNTDVKSLRQLASLHSDHGGQGFSKCICGSTCASKRCTCKKSGVKCNSHCHPRNTKCINKWKQNLMWITYLNLNFDIAEKVWIFARVYLLIFHYYIAETCSLIIQGQTPHSLYIVTRVYWLIFISLLVTLWVLHCWNVFCCVCLFLACFLLFFWSNSPVSFKSFNYEHISLHAGEKIQGWNTRSAERNTHIMLNLNVDEATVTHSL